MGADIMMVDGDLVLTSSGDIAIVVGAEELIQTAIHNVLLIYGELLDEPERGNMIYTRRVKLTGNGLLQVEEDSKNAILYDSRIADVPYIKATKSDSVAYECNIEFSIRDIDGNIYSTNVIMILGGI